MNTFSLLAIDLMSLEHLQAIAERFGYWVVFLGIALENTGVPLPGETLTVLGGFLAGSGELDYWLVLGSAIAGAVLGDNCGYWLGRWGGWPLVCQVAGWFRISEDKLLVVRTRFSQNAGKAVFFGRFVTLLRIFAGPLAGIAEMPYRRFVICNVAGAGLWALTMVSLAFFVGRVVPLAQLVQWTAQFGVGALGVLTLWVGVSWWLEGRKGKLDTTSLDTTSLD